MNLNPPQPPVAWLTSSGIDPEMGGIASVTRSCLAALSRGEATPALDRFVGLYSAPGPESRWHGDSMTFRNCSGSRLRFLFEITRQIVARPDLILYEHVDLAQCQVLLPKSLRRPYAVWGHGIELWRELPARKRETLERADLLIFNSAFTREKAASYHPWILDCPFRVVPLAREEDGRDRGKENSPPAERSRSILTVGRLLADRPKGHLEILEAMTEVRSAVPDAHWHIVGQGPWKECFAEQVARSPVAKHTTLHGFLSDEELQALYRSCRVFAMPSRGEGFGLVYAEAMAQGLPCIGSTLDAAPEVIGAGGSCIDLAEKGALASALIDHLGADEALFRERSTAARQRAAFFTPARFARDLEAALAAILP